MSERSEHGATPPRRRPDLDEVFGNVLPDTTRDERDPGEPESIEESWYERNRPPHHDSR